MLLLSFEERESKWLPDNLFSIQEIIIYMTRLNDNIMVYVKKIYFNAKDGTKIYEMSNGLSCTKNANGKWMII